MARYACTSLTAPDPTTGISSCNAWVELPVTAIEEITALTVSDWQVIVPAVMVLWATAWGLRHLRKAIF